MADSNLMALRYLAEAAWGTTPAAALKTLRYTSEGLNDITETVESAEIISDRQLRDLVRTGKYSQGPVNFELSYGTFDELLAGALCADWQTDTGLAGALLGTDLLENGTTKKSFTLEKQLTDLTNEYIAFKGCRVDTLSLNFALNAIATGSVGLLGKRGVAAGATVGTGAPAAASSTLPISVIDVAHMHEGGASLPGVTEFTVSLANNLRRQGELGAIDPYGIGLGGQRVTGTLVAYFESRALYEKYQNFSVSNAEIQVQDAAGNTYTFNFPSLRYGTGEVVAGGGDQDVVARLAWTARRDSTTGKSIRVARTAA